MYRYILIFALTAVLLTVLVTGSAVAENETGRDVVTIDNDHALADNGTIDDYRSGGVVSAETSSVDAELTIAESKADVGVDDELLPSDIRNHYLRIEYNEDFSRTLRIHVPREYITPYSQASVPSVTTDHHADFEPVRGGEYLEVVVHVDEPSDIVLPLQRDSAASYRAVEWADYRIETLTGWTAFSGDEWQYISSSDMAGNATLELEDVDDPDDMVVQYDAKRDDPDETWLNAPRSEDDDIGVHVMTRTEAGNETAYLVATTEEPADVRYKPVADPSDEASGWVNDAIEIPNRIIDGFDGIGDVVPLSSGVKL